MKLFSHKGNTVGIIKIFNDLHIPLLKVAMRKIEDNTTLMSFETEFINPGKISFLLNSLKKYDDSLKVVKKTIT